MSKPIGTWKLTMNTPFGVQTPTLSINESGGAYSGELDGATGASELEDLELNGDAFSFTTKVSTPMGKFRISFRGQAEGDTMSGTFKSMAGISEFSGERA